MIAAYGDEDTKRKALEGARSASVNSGAKFFEDVMSFVPGCPLSA